MGFLMTKLHIQTLLKLIEEKGDCLNATQSGCSSHTCPYYLHDENRCIHIHESDEKLLDIVQTDLRSFLESVMLSSAGE